MSYSNSKHQINTMSENADHTMSENSNIVYFVVLYFIPVST